MQDIERVIEEIRQGNESLREELIASHKAFILRYTSFICKRELDWANDDELSIALIALNRAVDKFEPNRGNKFITYARVLLKNSLIDYFRKQPACRVLPLEDTSRSGNRNNSREEAASLDYYAKELEIRDRAFELLLFKEELSAFGLSLAELPAVSPSHRDTRNCLKATARKICSNEELVKRIYKDKRLPLNDIQAFTGTTHKTLEKWRKYLLSLIVILTNPDLGILVEYIWVKEAENE